MAAVCLNLLTSFSADNLELICPGSNGYWIAVDELGVSGVLAAADAGARVRLRSEKVRHLATVFKWDTKTVQRLQAPLLGLVVVSEGRDIRVRTGAWDDKLCPLPTTSCKD